jgi:hypothetical protein
MKRASGITKAGFCREFHLDYEFDSHPLNGAVCRSLACQFVGDELWKQRWQNLDFHRNLAMERSLSRTRAIGRAFAIPANPIIVDGDSRWISASEIGTVSARGRHGFTRNIQAARPKKKNLVSQSSRFLPFPRLPASADVSRYVHTFSTETTDYAESRVRK